MADKSMHMAMLEELRKTKAKLITELEKLEAVEEWHSAQIGGNGHRDTPASSVAKTLKAQDVDETVESEAGLTKWERCREALLGLGKPARVPEISKMVHPGGFITPAAQRVYNNSLYNAMNRKPEVFRQVPGSSEWELVKSEGGK